MKIIRLEAENVKRIRAVRIVPEGAAVVIGGNNGEGKTSVLDSIAYALGGKGAICEQPIRTGSRKARVICELDEEGLVVTRTFARGKPDKLVVADKAGVPRRGPQAILDALVGKLTFDPLGFVSMKPRDQLDTLKALVGLDFSELNLKRERLYDERTAVNRTAKSLRAQLAAIPLDLDAPDTEVSVAELMTELEQVQAANEETRRLLGHAEVVEATMKGLHDKITEARERIEAWKTEIKGNKGALAAEAEHLAAIHEQLVAVQPHDPSPIRERIAAAEGINEKVRRRQQQVRLAQEVAADDDRSERLSGLIEAIDADKAAQLAAAEFPVPGLGFDEDRVLLNELPFDQASSAEQLRISVAMGLALNPKLKVLLIRDGSLLDANSLRMVAEMAEAHDAQVWIEKVSEGPECSVIIEDGRVKGSTDSTDSTDDREPTEDEVATDRERARAMQVNDCGGQGQPSDV